MTQREWWQSQLDWHELNRPSDPAWHDSQIRYYEAALFWNRPHPLYDIPHTKLSTDPA